MVVVVGGDVCGGGRRRRGWSVRCVGGRRRLPEVVTKGLHRGLFPVAVDKEQADEHDDRNHQHHRHDY